MRNGAKPRFAKAASMVVIAAAIGAFGWTEAASQSGIQQSGTAPNSKPPDFSSGMEGPSNSPGVERRLEHMREDDRHKRLEGDAQRLLQMATELKEQVDKTPKDQLSIEVIRRAAEIEKLARDIRERMKN